LIQFVSSHYIFEADQKHFIKIDIKIMYITLTKSFLFRISILMKKL